MSGYGIPIAEIARLVKIDIDTLRKHYGAELDQGATIANAAVAKNLYRIARGTGREAVTAAMFWLKTRAGWSEYSPKSAPQPAQDDPRESLGKKELANINAQDAEQGTSWASLLN